MRDPTPDVAGIIPIGTRVPPYGVVKGVRTDGTERFYLLRKGNDVALMPASLIEPARPTGARPTEEER